MTAAKVYRLSESRLEERGGVRAHLHLKQHATKRLALNRAVFDRVKTVLFYTTREILTKLCYRLFIKESYQFVENGHPMTPLKP